MRSPAEVDRSRSREPDRAGHAFGRRNRAEYLLRQSGDAIRQAARRLSTHPTDANQTIVTVFLALAVETNIFLKKKEFSKVPVLRNLVPAQVLAGKSSFNTGNSISAGLPVYARNQVKAMAAILDRKAITSSAAIPLYNPLVNLSFRGAAPKRRHPESSPPLIAGCRPPGLRLASTSPRNKRFRKNAPSHYC